MMDRLFWKFFILIWVVHLLGTMGVMMLPIEPIFAHMIASLIAAAILAHYLSRPLCKLRDAIRATASTGKLQVGVADAVKTRTDELSELLREFDRMAELLRTLMDGQQQLLHDVSHEMRSPLARMRAAIGLAKQQPARMKNLLSQIDNEIARIDRLVDEQLTFSRLEAGALKISEEPLCVDEILEHILDDALLETRSKNQSLRSCRCSNARIYGNSALMHRAIENVIRNAIRHTPEKSTIFLNAENDESAGQLTITVCDTGEGVPDEELESIFEPFFRCSWAERNNDGHGLGLAIAKRVIQAHDGSIRAFNRREGGLCVEMVIPTDRCS